MITHEWWADPVRDPKISLEIEVVNERVRLADPFAVDLGLLGRKTTHAFGLGQFRLIESTWFEYEEVASAFRDAGFVLLRQEEFQ